MEYNNVDVFITGRLYLSQSFDVILYYFNLEKINGIAWDCAASKKRTPSAIMSSFATYRHYQFTQPAVLRPGWVQTKLVFRELIDYFTHPTQARDLNQINTEDARQIILDYHSGACALKTEYKKIEGFKRLSNDLIDYEEFFNCFERQLKQNRSLFRQYDTVALVVLLTYLTTPHKNLLDYDCHFSKFLTAYKDTHLFKDKQSYMCEMGKLKDFFYYLVVIRGPLGLSPQENIVTLWTDFYSAYNNDLNVALLEKFASDIIGDPNTGRLRQEAYDAVMSCYKTIKFRKIDFDHEAIMKLLTSKSENMAVKLLPFDGAFIMDPLVGIITKYSVVVMDITSQYPSCIQELNIGLETHISLDYIMKNNLKEGIDFKAINRRRTDDNVVYHWYLERGMIDYVKTNYIFFLNQPTSCTNIQYKREIEFRLKHKKLIKGITDPVEKENAEHICSAYKIVINSYYGVIGQIMLARFLPAVTAMGRKSIQNVRKVLIDIYGDQVLFIYGDTDSIFFHFLKTNEEIISMSIQEPTSYFNGSAYLVTQDQIREIYESEIMQDGSKNVQYKASYIVNTTLEKYVCPVVNAQTSQKIKIEVEKTMSPLALWGRKKICWLYPSY